MRVKIYKCISMQQYCYDRFVWKHESFAPKRKNWDFEASLEKRAKNATMEKWTFVTLSWKTFSI